MLFHLSSEFVEHDGAVFAGNDAFQALVGELLRAHRAGRHELVAARETWGWLAPTLAELGAMERGVARRLSDKVFAFRSALAACPEHVEISPGEAWGDAVPGRPLRVPWRTIAPNGSLPPTVLLGEDVDRDAPVYFALAKAVGKATHWNVNFGLRGGGGNATGSNFEQASKEGGLVVAVVDQDRRAPAASIGDTPWKALQAAILWGAMVERFEHGRGTDPAPKGRVVARLIVLPARSLENLLTPTLWQRTGQPEPATHTLRLLGNGVWADAKKGPRCRGGIGPGAEAAYLRNLFPELPWCPSHEECSETKGAACDRRLVPGLGAGALQLVARSLGAPLTPDEIGAPLREVGRVLAMWGRAAEPLRA